MSSPRATEADPSVPTARYTDPAFLAAEQRLLQQSWLLAGLSSDLPQAGCYAVADVGGVSVLLTRAGDGQARAFRNICRHRGVLLAEGAGPAEALRCPYHGWVYELDGRLRGVSRPEGYSHLDRDAAGLRPLRVEEQGGLVWVAFSPPPVALAPWLGGVPDLLAPYALEQMRPVQTADWILPGNWKVALEQAIDFYHVPAVHQLLLPHIAAEPEMTRLGAHSHQVLPIKTSSHLRRALDRATSRGGPYSDAQRTQLQKLFLFPNLVINVLPYHLTVMQFWPEGQDRCRLRYRFCLRDGAGSLERLRVYASWLASRWILYEDVRLLERIRAGHAQAGGLEQPLHQHERAVAHFHATLGAALAS